MSIRTVTLESPEEPLIDPNRFLKYVNPDGGLPYSPGTSSFSEPSLLMILALVATGESSRAKSLIDWALTSTNSDGSIGVNRHFPQEGLWNTALLAIAMHRLGMIHRRDTAIDFLLQYRSIPVARAPENDLDTSLIGWPWVSSTFGWVEPTAWAIMALSLAGKGEHSRVAEGRRLLQDRCLKDGGWNYGNKVVFGNSLIPFWDSTSIALLALDEKDSICLDRSIRLLEASVSDIYSLYSMSLACLCLSRFGRNVARIREQIGTLLANSPDEGLNLAHCAIGLLALSPEKVLTP